MPQVRTLKPDREKIRACRLRLVLTPEQVAQKIHRHPQTVRRIENGGITEVSEILMHQLAVALGAEVAEITKAESAA
jgi:DNA-binding XRE family transcriptional regulator